MKRACDHMVRGTAADGQIRCFAATTRDLVEEARQRHHTSPVVTAALGRLLTGGAMMGLMMKDPGDLLTIQIQGDGPVGGLTVTADAFGHVKGYAKQPVVSLPARSDGKLDVGKAVGSGVLTVIKDMGLKEPYQGQVGLSSGEIAEDLTYYFAVSEQTPSSVALGVRMNKNNTVGQAGGYMIQLMPDTEDGVVEALERRLSAMDPVTTLLSEGHTPESMLELILKGFGVSFSDERIPAGFFCNCSRERVSRVLASIGKKELDDIIADGESVEINCHFCNTGYRFDIDELRQIKKTL